MSNILPMGTARGTRSPGPYSRSTSTPSGLGWDQPARLFALVDTAQLRAQEPASPTQLGLADEPRRTGLTPIEQDELPAGTPLDEFLATIAWPDAVRRLRADRRAADAAAVRGGVGPAGAERHAAGGLGGRAPGPAGGPDDGRGAARRRPRVGGAAAGEGRRRPRCSPARDLVPGLAEALSATFAED